jgi:cysteinyl-tRNA synthetase
MISSNEALSRIQNAFMNLRNISADTGSFKLDSKKMIAEFRNLLDNNFDTRSVFSLLMEKVTEINRNIGDISRESAKDILEIFHFIDRIFAILKTDESEYHISKLIESIIELRQTFRKEKDFQHSDMIRKMLKESGIHIEDSGDSVRWRIE